MSHIITVTRTLTYEQQYTVEADGALTEQDLQAIGAHLSETVDLSEMGVRIDTQSVHLNQPADEDRWQVSPIKVSVTDKALRIVEPSFMPFEMARPTPGAETTPDTYNHAYTLAFEVPGSTDEQAEDVTQEQMLESLMSAIYGHVRKNTLVAAVGSAFDTHQED